MRAIWKGAIRFGPVNIPVALCPATRREELKFRLPRESDLSPVNTKRVAEADDHVAIPKVVIKTRQHLAAVKPQAKVLVLELIHFPDELLDPAESKFQAGSSPPKTELRMALKLIESMTVNWAPERYTDEYLDQLEHFIEEKIAHGDKTLPPPTTRRRPASVVDLVSVLQQSIKETERAESRGGAKKKPKAKAWPRRRAA